MATTIEQQALNHIADHGGTPPGAINKDKVRFKTHPKDPKPGAGYIRSSSDVITVDSFDTKIPKAVFHTKREPGVRVSKVEQKERKAKRYKEKKAERQLQQKNINAAHTMYQAAQEFSGFHKYLHKKKLNPKLLGEVKESFGELLFPIRDITGRFNGVLRINENGTKMLTQGTRLHESFYYIPGFDSKPLSFAEGISTGLAIAEEKHCPVVCCLGCNNLEAVALVWRNQFTDKPFDFWADNDSATEKKTGSNPGVDAARAAAKLVGGEVFIPDSPNGENVDWCDVFSGKKNDS